MKDQVPYNQPTAAPTPKMQSVAISGAILTVLTIVAALFHITLPEGLKNNVDALVAGVVALTSLIHFIAGYFTKDKKPAEAVEAIISADVTHSYEH